jgi:hypothetical protein
MKPEATRAVLLFVGAVALWIGIGTRSWITSDEPSLHGGLTSVEFCGRSDDCETMWFVKQLKHGHAREIMMTIGGLGATIMGGAANILAIIAGAMLLAGRRKKVLATLAMVFVSVAACNAIMFVAAIDKGGGLSWGYSAALFFIGFAVMLTGTILVMTGPSSSPAFAGGAQMPMPMPTGAPPPCPTCSTGTTFVAQYQRFYCARCNRYL